MNIIITSANESFGYITLPYPLSVMKKKLTLAIIFEPCCKGFMLHKWILCDKT